jgi:hypothetical protein
LKFCRLRSIRDSPAPQSQVMKMRGNPSSAVPAPDF